MDRLFYIPEFTEGVYQYLDKNSRVCCVCVSKRWFDQFVPLLWHTFGQGPEDPVNPGLIAPPSGAECFPPDAFPVKVADPTPQGPNRAGLALSLVNQYNKATLDTTSWADKREHKWDPMLYPSIRRLNERKIAEIQAIVGKYAHHIRQLGIHTVNAFRVFEHACTRLNAFQCRFGPFLVFGRMTQWYEEFSDAQIRQIRHDVARFVSRQPHLNSLYLLPILARGTDVVPKALHGPPVRYWQHFDVMLDDQAFLDIHKLLPVVRSACFKLQSIATLAEPLATPHTNLKELQLSVPAKALGARELTNIFASFPNLQRILVYPIGSPLIMLDWVYDNGSYLFLDEGSLKRREPPNILVAVPNLITLIGARVSSDYYTPLATKHHQSLVHVGIDKSGPDFAGVDIPDDINNIPPPTIIKLLAHCPNLKNVVCPSEVLHVMHVLEQPLAVKNGEHLVCTIVGVPRITHEERHDYFALKEGRMTHGSPKSMDLMRRIQTRDLFRNRLCFKRIRDLLHPDFMHEPVEPNIDAIRSIGLGRSRDDFARILMANGFRRTPL